MTKNSKVTGQQLYTLDSLGLVVARDIIPKSKLKELNRLIDAHINKRSPGKFTIMDIDDVFLELMAMPWVVSICKKIIGPNFRFDHAFGLQQPGEGVALNLHGGPLTSQGCNYYVSNSGTIRCGRVSVSIPLTRQDPEIGGFAYIPGSHKSSFLLTGNEIFKDLLNDDFDHDCITIPVLNPGDICLFVDGLVHGTAFWKSNSYRRALYYMYSPGFVAWRPHDQIKKYLDRATTETQKKLLSPPYVAEFEDEELKVGGNVWRKEVQ